MNVSLTPELEAFIQQKVQSGRYYSASEVVREGLRLLEERDRRQNWSLETLQAEIQKGVNSLDAGQGIPVDDNTAASVKERGRNRLSKSKK